MPFRRRALLRHAIAIAGTSSLLPAEALARQRTVHHAHRHHRARKLPVVIIDPGHGGKDPGCTGLGGTEEKHVLLKLGVDLRRELRAGGHCKVEMTRDTDVFVPLEDRVAFARIHHAALFVSLHANAAPKNRHACGLCVYRFSYRASDAQARAMARWENSADRFGGPSFHHVSPEVTHNLASLMRRETWLHSAWLQDSIVNTLRDHIQLESVPARHTRFVVLSVETSFPTNTHDERLLRSLHYCHLMAREMRRAIEHSLAHIAHTTHAVR